MKSINESHEVPSSFLSTYRLTPRIMRLFVLSSGYVAVFTNSLDAVYWGSIVIPLAFGSEVSAAQAVERMQKVNPENTVVFAGGLTEYKSFMAIP